MNVSVNGGKRDEEDAFVEPERPNIPPDKAKKFLRTKSEIVQERDGRRSNGFDKPLNGFQIGTWILFTLFVLEFFLFVTPSILIISNFFIFLPIIFTCFANITFIFITI
eukprot:c28843_g1_i1.p1 GENE.c28843_g1_i1~~c28843_g1_i1.p1  ORF type:complete len:109 (-),score=26.97 c28843_g1_i1:3-329(-)